MVLVMLSIALNLFKFNTITMNYLITGNSQNEKDSAHSCIAKQTTNMAIFTLDQWETAIQMSFVKNEVEIIRIGHNDILNFKDSTSLFPYRNMLCYDTKGNDDGSKVYWSKIMQVKFTQERPLDMLFKYNYSDTEYKSAELAHFATSTSSFIILVYLHAKVRQ